MEKVILNENLCKGCGLCIHVCPKKILSMDTSRVNTRGYNPVVCKNTADCISCAFCATICPDLVIAVNKE